MLRGTTSALATHSGMAAHHQAFGLLQGAVARQATMLAYVDNFHILSIASLVLIPFVFLIKKPKHLGAVQAH
jgi:hypothetical protein